MKLDMRKGNKKKISKKTLIILVAIIMLFITIVLARYVMEASTGAYAIESMEFYFNSNALKESTELYDWNEGENYLLTIDLNNFEDSQRYSGNNIDYEISIENKSDCNIQANVTGGTLQTGDFNTNNFVVTIDDTQKSIEYAEFTVVVKSTGKYKKTLTGNFKIYKKDNRDYKANLLNENGEEDAKLHIATYNNPQTLRISYDNTKVLIERTKDILQGVEIQTTETTSTLEIQMQANQSILLDFIKLNNNVSLTYGTDIIVMK